MRDWNQFWLDKKTPWDQGKSHPELVYLLENNNEFKKGGRALVPGCGTGYDAVLFGSKGFESVGLDISPEAVKVAREHLSKYPDLQDKVAFIAGNFFDFPSGTGFDIVYDYTFFCAIDPSQREAWGKRMAQIINPGGFLVTLMFPLDPEVPNPSGPPFPVSVEAYKKVLGEFEFVSVRDARGSLPARENREKIGLWRRK